MCSIINAIKGMLFGKGIDAAFEHNMTKTEN